MKIGLVTIRSRRNVSRKTNNLWAKRLNETSENSTFLTIK